MTDSQHPTDTATADALESVSSTEESIDQHDGGEPTELSDETPTPADEAGESAPDGEASESTSHIDVDADVPSDDIDDSTTGDVAEELMLDLEVEPPAGEVVLDDVSMRRALEAILMVTDEPLPALVLARAVGRPVGDVSEALSGLAEEYTEQGRGFDLREVGGGWRYYTRPEQAQYVEKFVLDGQQARLTQAALETLAVVAYKQPVSRARVSAIRGVNVDGVMRTLISRGLVEEAGADTESQATLYRTSSYFLERMGMQSLDDLPELAPYLPEMDDVEEELAAQNTPTPEDLPTDGAGTPDGTPEAVGTPEPDEAVTSDVGAAGIDGDLSIGDAPDLDLEHEEDELEPAEELEAGGDTELAQEEADPAEFPESGDAGAGDSEGTDDERGDSVDPDGAEHGVSDDDPLGDSDSDDGTGEDDGDEDDEDDDRLEPAEELTAESGDDLLDPADEPADDSPAADGVPAEGDGTTGAAAGPGAAQYRVGSDD
ncbi:SMC-Scp complex subunit ScpB [Kribbella sp. ALI-6-A]|uniref:SMC-Scp complex subunit ScpB n=1 Tax=Kribbella sp. ALI-6-A TaxID=1933817 RepID=UPI00269005E6|nr:SMC-Scp complex subunit ScpB [Kribbella sp. ALI-6-A]